MDMASHCTLPTTFTPPPTEIDPKQKQLDRSMETAAAAPGAPASCEIARLPEDLLLASFARAGPVAACRAAAVCQAFHAATDTNALWACFLPHDLPPFADMELSPPPPSKKALFMRLSDGPVLLADGLTSMCLHRETGAACYMLSARKLSIAGSDTPAYWRWIPVTGSRFSEAAELHNFRWLEICGKIDSKMLSQHTTYTAYIVFRVDDRCYGLHSPCQETSVSIGGRKFTRNVCLGGHDVGIAWLLVMRGDIPDDSKFPEERDDGWMELEMGEFHNGEGEDGEVSISLSETSAVKSGLVVLGIEIRPKGLLSTSIARKRPVVWLAFHAPCNLPLLADGEVSAPLVSKKALFLRLLDGPVLLADGLTSLWLDRDTGVMCYMLSARKLSIAWGDNPTYWHWIPITGSSRFSEATEFHHFRWLEICGKIDSKILSQHTTYVVYIVFRVDSRWYGLDYPCQETSVNIGGRNLMHSVCLAGHLVHAWLLAMRGDIPEDTLFPSERADGWIELKMGEFHNNEDDDGEVSISLTETSTVKSGLVVLGIEIRPKKERGPRGLRLIK